MKAKLIVLAVAATVLGSACTVTQTRGEYDQGSYKGQHAMKAGRAVEMTVVSVRPVEIRPTASGTRKMTGAAVGGALGGLAGAQVSSSKTRQVGAVVGGLLGAAGGAALIGDGSPVAGQEIVLRDKNGNHLVVVQAGTEVQAGERAFVVETGGEYRVTRKPG